MDAALLALRDRLVDQGTAELSAAPETLQFTGEQTVDALINDIQSYPHAFVLAALVDRQVDAKIAWRLPGKVRERVGTFEIDDLAKLDRGAWIKVLREPTPLHRFIETMAGVLELGVRRIIGQYGGDASAIWSDTPSSKVVVNRFLEFHGAGPKIATMAANILVRGFHVPMADYGAIDISADVQVCRVMGRLGFVPEDPGLEEVVRAARTLSPDFPGVLICRSGGSAAHSAALPTPTAPSAWSVISAPMLAALAASQCRMQKPTRGQRCRCHGPRRRWPPWRMRSSN